MYTYLSFDEDTFHFSAPVLISFKRRVLPVEMITFSPKDKISDEDERELISYKRLPSKAFHTLTYLLDDEDERDAILSFPIEYNLSIFSSSLKTLLQTILNNNFHSKCVDSTIQ